MKIVCIVALGLLACSESFAQLSNSEWVGNIKGDQPRRVYLNFKNGACSVYTVSDSSMVETMVYSTEGNQFTVRKIEGQSDCDNNTSGKYSFKIVKDSIFIKAVDDPCEDRSSALNNFGAVRWKKHTEIKVAPGVLQQYVGTYQFNADREVIISFENGSLQIEGPKIGLPKLPLLAISNNRFFLKIAYVEFEFVKDASGKVTQMISYEENKAVLKKVK